MATTAQDLIKRAMRLTGAIGSGETLTSDELQDGLAALNSMLDSWWLQGLAVYQIGSETLSWASGQTSRTIGSGGDFDTTRPVKIDSAFQRINNIDYPIHVITDKQYRGIPDKSTSTDLVQMIYYDQGYPLGTLYAWPVPSVVVAIHLQTWSQIESFATATEAISLPPGYRRAIEYNLAIDLAPEYQRSIQPAVLRVAAVGLRDVKRMNIRIPRMVNEPGVLARSHRRTWDWRTG